MPITVSQAIKIVETEAHLAKRQPETGVYDALRLSIEALESHQRALKGFTNPEKFLLPGETLEEEVKS